MIYFRRCPRILDDPGLSNIVTLTLLLIASPKYVKNPYLLVKLVEVRKTRNLAFKLLSLCVSLSLSVSVSLSLSVCLSLSLPSFPLSLSFP